METSDERHPDIKSVQQPVQFLWGENDPFGNLDVAHQAVRIVSDAALQVMITGHLPFLDQPEACGRVIGEFLSMQPR